MSANPIEWIIGGPLLLIMLGASWWAMSEGQKRLEDPSDDRTVYLDQLVTKLALAPRGIYRVTIMRQSGIIHAEHLVTGTARDALAKLTSTFARAKIGAVHVGENTAERLRVGRMFHDHRGSNEGKKVGSAVIELIGRAQRPPPPEGSVSLEPIRYECDDCGEAMQFDFNERAEERFCIGCGTEHTLSASKVVELEDAVETARADALERWNAGEDRVLINRTVKGDGGG